VTCSIQKVLRERERVEAEINKTQDSPERNADHGKRKSDRIEKRDKKMFIEAFVGYGRRRCEDSPSDNSKDYQKGWDDKEIPGVKNTIQVCESGASTGRHSRGGHQICA